MPSLIFGGGGGPQYTGGSLIQPFALPPANPSAYGGTGPGRSGLQQELVGPNLNPGLSRDGWGYGSEELGQTATPWAEWPAWQRNSFGALLGAGVGFAAPGLSSLFGAGMDVANSRAEGAGWGAALGTAAASQLGVPGGIVDWFRNRFGSGGDQQEFVGPPEAEVPKGTIPQPNIRGMHINPFGGYADPLSAGDMMNRYGAAGFYGGSKAQQDVLDGWLGGGW